MELWGRTSVAQGATEIAIGFAASRRPGLRAFGRMERKKRNAFSKTVAAFLSHFGARGNPDNPRSNGEYSLIHGNPKVWPEGTR